MYALNSQKIHMEMTINASKYVLKEKSLKMTHNFVSMLTPVLDLPGQISYQNTAFLDVHPCQDSMGIMVRLLVFKDVRPPQNCMETMSLPHVSQSAVILMEKGDLQILFLRRACLSVP